jgi:hypothetical protein
VEAARHARARALETAAARAEVGGAMKRLQRSESGDRRRAEAAAGVLGVWMR